MHAIVLLITHVKTVMKKQALLCYCTLTFATVALFDACQPRRTAKSSQESRPDPELESLKQAYNLRELTPEEVQKIGPLPKFSTVEEARAYFSRQRAAMRGRMAGRKDTLVPPQTGFADVVDTVRRGDSTNVRIRIQTDCQPTKLQ